MTCLTYHFESLISIIGIFSICSFRTNGYCDLLFDAFQLLIENYCDYYDYLLVLSSCSWRTDVNNVDYLLMLSSHLYRNEVILL